MPHPFVNMDPLEEMYLRAMSADDDATVVQLVENGFSWDDWTLDTRHYLLRKPKYLSLLFACGYTVVARDAIDFIMNDPCRVRSLA